MQNFPVQMYRIIFFIVDFIEIKRILLKDFLDTLFRKLLKILSNSFYTIRKVLSQQIKNFR